MDYTEEIAANNAKIAELKAKLAKLESAPTMGSDAMDYALAANRADYGDLSGAQYHLNKPEERARMAKLFEMNGSSFNNDLETQYVTLQDNLLEAQRNKALTPKENKALVAQAEREEKTAALRLKMFERKHPNLTKMHWKWRDEAAKELGFNDNNYLTNTPENTIQGFYDIVNQNSYTDGGTGTTFWKDDADTPKIMAYLQGIPNWREYPQLRDYVDNNLALRQKMSGAVSARTSENLKNLMNNPEYMNKGGYPKSRGKQKELLDFYNGMSEADRNANQDLLNKIKAKPEDVRKEEAKAIDEEARAELRKMSGRVQKEFELGRKSEFVGKNGKKYVLDRKTNMFSAAK